MSESSLHNDQIGAPDWQTLHQRLADSGVTESSEMSREEMERVWAARAAELAAVPVEEDAGEHIRLLLVRLGREIYGIDAHYVFSVKPAEFITRVPRVPDWVGGVVNLRGRIFSVVDLRSFFGLPTASADEQGAAEGSSDASYLVVVETSDMEIALQVDDVLTVDSFPLSRMQDAAGTVRGLRPEYVDGIITGYQTTGVASDPAANGVMIVVLDLSTLLRDERLIVHEEIM
jgi:purine-binding chemotaxis protein CheW